MTSENLNPRPAMIRSAAENIGRIDMDLIRDTAMPGNALELSLVGVGAYTQDREAPFIRFGGYDEDEDDFEEEDDFDDFSDEEEEFEDDEDDFDDDDDDFDDDFEEEEEEEEEDYDYEDDIDYNDFDE
jgi:hypothetical protein